MTLNICITTETELTGKCDKMWCAHWYYPSPTRCLQHVYERALTPTDIGTMFKVEGIRHVLKRGEAKIILAGKIVANAERMRSYPLIPIMKRAYEVNYGFRSLIANPLDVFPQFFQIIPTDKWIPSFKAYEKPLMEIGLTTESNVADINRLIRSRKVTK